MKGELVMKTINKQCMMCKQNVEIKVKAEDFQSWQEGAFIQNAFPYLSIDEREILISNICGTCFDKMFS